MAGETLAPGLQDEHMPEIAARFFAHYRLARPDDVEGANTWPAPCAS
ncbi:hypothetical protein ACRAWD_15725 [Caulobacter segnis]